MASSVFPLPVTSSAGNLAKSVTIPTAGTLYSATTALSAGIYTITCASSTITNIEFYTGTTFISTATTVSGSITYNLGTDATSMRIYTNTGSNIVVNILLSGQSVSAVSGTLDIITASTANYNQTGSVYVIAIGGGGGGGSYNSGYGAGGGGGSGGIHQGRAVLSGTTAITIGAAGNVNGGTAGTTTVGNLFTANGGGQGTPPNDNANGGGGGGGGAAGTPGGGAGGNGGAHIINQGNSNAPGQGAASSASQFSYVVSGTTGGGSGGNPQQTFNPAVVGSGIGTGGNPITSPTGYGSGGAGKSVYTSGAQNGRDGVVYILRGF